MSEFNEAWAATPQFISMLSDYGFKVTFGNEHRPKFIKKALQALIASDEPIKKVRFIKNEVSGTTKEARGGLLDITCEDEQGRIFIVEMQLLNLTHFIHRVKFYAFHVYNTMVRKGNYRFDDLRPIYTISILAGKTYNTELYHQISTLKNQQGELVDNQITHVIVELGKFSKTLDEIETDLDKLLYTMKLTDDTTQKAKLPDFWREGWLEEALHELETSNLTPEQRAQYEIMIAGNMSVKYARQAEMKEEVDKRVDEKLEEARAEAKAEAILNMINSGLLTDEQIASIQEVRVEEVKRIRKETEKKGR